MTNVCVARSFDRRKSEHTAWVLDKVATETRRKKEDDGIFEEEIQLMYKQADRIFANNDYFRLRAKAIVAIADKNGNRRSEIVLLKVSEVKEITERNELELKFTLSKKRKKGQQQYRAHLLKLVNKGELTYQEYQNKTIAEIEKGWREWQKTSEGVCIKTPTSKKSITLDSQAARIILGYRNWIIRNHPGSKYLFPKNKMVYGDYYFFDDRHADGSTLLSIVKQLNPNVWMHLFRSTKAGHIADKFGRTINAVHEVKDALDLEKEETAWNYIKNKVAKKMD
jgi:hypothetical protein